MAELTVRIEEATPSSGPPRGPAAAGPPSLPASNATRAMPPVGPGQAASPSSKPSSSAGSPSYIAENEIRALHQIIAEKNRQLVEGVRARTDPAYAQEKGSREQGEADSHKRQRLAFAGQAFAMAGMPGIGAVLSGGAAAGTAGAIIAAIDQGFKKAVGAIQVGTGIGSSIAGFEPDRLARGFADLAQKVPIVGGVLGVFAHGTLDMADSLMGTAQRLSAYNSQLATQLAQLQIRNINRDIRRANQFGPEIMKGVEARQQFIEKMQDFLDKNFPMLVKAMESLLDLAKILIPSVGGIAKLVLDLIKLVADALKTIIGNKPWLRRLLEQISTNTEPLQNQQVAADFLSQLRRAGNWETDENEAVRDRNLPASRAPQPGFGF